jgi:acyl-CoA oxidase
MSTFNNNIATKFPDLKPRGPGGEALLEAERAKTSFDVKSLSKFMYTEEWLDKMYKVLRVIENEPAFDKTNRYYQSRADKIKTSLWKDRRMIEIAR